MLGDFCATDDQTPTENSVSKMSTPSQIGYHMPAEWEPHSAIWLSWPHDPLTFPNVEEAERAYVQIIAAIHTSEMVNLQVLDAEMEERVSALLATANVDLSRVRFWKNDYADVWFRDYGPIFVKNQEGKLAMTHWIFNAWGNKYEELLKDTNVPMFMNQTLKMERFTPNIVLEGGSIEVNGAGILVTTEQCLLNKNRNPQLTKTQIEQYLKDYLGVRKILWLKEGIEGDDTDGHIDDIARFVAPNTILCAYEDNPTDPNHAILKENYERLQRMTDQQGKLLKIIKLPMPGYVRDDQGLIDEAKRRLPASYANFYVVNTVVLVPVFGHQNDEKALNIIGQCFPGRKVVGINCRWLVYGLGTLHCISQQQPTSSFKEKQ